MSLDRNLSAYRELYYETSQANQRTIDNAVDAACQVLKKSGFDLTYDDRCENLVTAVVKYLVESGNAI